MASAMLQKAQGAFAQMTERERRLLMGMGAVFVVLALLGIAYAFHSSLERKRDEIERYDKALAALVEVAPAYLAAKQAPADDDRRARRFSAEALANNDLKLTGFVAKKAGEVDLQIDNYDEDEIPISGKKGDGPLIIENQLRASIRDAELNKVLALLDSIERSEEPLIVQRINLRDVRNKPGRVRADLVISTYIQREREKD